MLHYKTYQLGENYDWVVFVHGAGGSSNIWYKQIKRFKKYFNLLLIDLRGHGKSKDLIRQSHRNYTFHEVSKDVLEVVDHLKITSAHFIGVSLGTIIIQTIAETSPSKIRSMILAGAVTKLNLRSNFLISIGNLGKYILPYMWLYKLFAWIIMPRERHTHSRLLFVNEAKKLCQKEFIRWFKLTKNINPFLKNIRMKEFQIPTLYIMGEEDYMFLPPIQSFIKEKKYSRLVVLKNCGHVCNVDQAEEFNRVSISFIKGLHLLVQKDPKYHA
ncbi:alpha/beta hydrolase [Microaerobacter geothermalis]|uniref:alpha/beta fold hydrolase n=1 Tax=Microaerobacter geothermalis TaxID=674972 RepID=UPI001F3DA496|nr:alpha/beta hydrolase [Microaerobacter geothermalis]MCF6093783.1 alpha/beta hydrolase [Microaerobacter geothermalis]